MARGRGYNKYNSSRGGASTRGGSTGGNSPRGRGYRGRARGGRGGGGGRGGYIGYNPSDDTDFVLQTYNNNYDTGRYFSAPSTPQSRGRGRGRGLGSNNSPQSINNYQAKRNRGRGRGRDGYDNPRNDRGSNNSDAPLSLSLRPLLRPVVFVPATQNRFLFQAEEELIQPIVEDAGDEEQSHLPTADRVARLFSGTYQHQEVDDSNDTEGLEEIDFSDVGRFQQVMDGFASGAAAAVGKGDVEEIVEMEEGSPRPTDVFEEAELLLQEETASSVKESLDTVTTEPDGSNQFPRNVEMLASTSLSISTGDADPELAQVSSSIQSIAIQDEPRPRKDEDMQSQEPTQQENPTFFVDMVLDWALLPSLMMTATSLSTLLLIPVKADLQLRRLLQDFGRRLEPPPS
ncbi:hypothetical protein F5879DRAFT_48672 [Lentinula edodes]|nr:hypothetical protein F5879DRAFT_48672 [Lentinula edodes]